MKDIILATSNKGKIQEIQAILAPFHCLSMADFNIESPEETGLSFVENALIKARHTSEKSGKPALADDSGLVVPALNGAPGIHSARFAGEEASDSDNIQLLLEKMEHFADAQRQAYFFCAIALLRSPDDPVPLLAYGKIKGRIIHEPKGTKGFGYDPVFYIPEYHCTAAELAPELKNTISHRGQALAQLQHELKEFL
ncbi:deoxyribonucleotide triphosphate pyrophosphatase [Legionella birminghamensis]|uniref:dITP/XTP pyrophosphatase n=1 Tax=Legionella birminghamensis TaxID=28083 RepID=A0A378ILC5_9GAMM|nr:RdgB/HAM1 family non-canonical purine NTP pyrophosphatase [Legionella birminghamensis]KTC66774.1 deoxyribonucleotide triphosphate pyrophosphatase [Legionella birminghamensis]STX32924.1 ribosomal protein Ham1 [Legionella birminghamensis]